MQRHPGDDRRQRFLAVGAEDADVRVRDEDDVAADSTRFVVAEKPPTGDEEKDFADMLAQFKQRYPGVELTLVV